MKKEELIYQLESRLSKICPQIVTEPTIVKYKGQTKKSEWSRQMIPDKEISKCDFLQKAFGIECEHWGALYEQAVSGNRKKKEEDKIMTLHSSSLLALLCFSSVSKEKPLVIGNISYTKVWFEIKNKVYNNPSNIDVVLESEEEDLLFLESKFTEYLTPDNNAFALTYFDFYKSILPEFDGAPLQMIFPRTYNKENGMGLIATSRKKDYELLYMDGIKQCFSHLIGLCKGPSSDSKLQWSDKKGRIQFATILYKFKCKNFNVYSDFYQLTIAKVNTSKLKNALSKEITPFIERVEILPNVITYQKVFQDYPLPAKVREYYDL